MNKEYKIFLINLKRDEDRLAFMSRQLKDRGLEFTVQEGVDGQKYDFGNLCNPDKFTESKAKITYLAAKGCAMSHKLALEKFLGDKQLNYALVLEDDVELPKKMKEVIEDEIKNRDLEKTNWEYLSFNYPTVGLKFVELWLYLFINMFKEKKSFKLYLGLPIFFLKFILISFMSALEKMREMIYSRLYRYGRPALFYRPLYLAGCYLINRHGAEKLLNLNKRLEYEADRLPNVARVKNSLKYYAFVPLLVKQKREVFGSNITSDKTFTF